MRVWISQWMAVVVCSLSLAGCGSGPGAGSGANDEHAPPCPPAEPAPIGALPACSGVPAAEYGKRKELPHNDLPPEALTANALTKDTEALRALVSSKLTSELFAGKTGPLAAALNDANARALLRDIVSCALDPDAEVGPSPEKSDGDHSPPWKGDLGLCGKLSPAGDWSQAPPTPHCLELVSGCVLARVNAQGKRVVLSLRGQPECLFPLRDEVPVETRYRENHGATLIPSFGECDDSVDPADSCRSCGWAPRHVGRCAAGATVTLKAATGTLIRVCRGLHGCGPTDSSLVYSGTLESIPPSSCGASGKDIVTFECPDNGPDEDANYDTLSPHRWGYYSVMFASATNVDPATLLSLEDATSGDCTAPFDDPAFLPCNSYPATEEQVFTYRAGAFYGDIFGGVTAGNTCAAHPPELLGGQEYACFSEIWAQGPAVLQNQLCAKPGPSCLENKPGPCWSDGSDHLCTGGEAQSPGETPKEGYRDCHGPDAKSGAWAMPVTVYLNHPCDLARSDTCGIGKNDIVPPQE